MVYIKTDSRYKTNSFRIISQREAKVFKYLLCIVFWIQISEFNTGGCEGICPVGRSVSCARVRKKRNQARTYIHA